MYALCQFIRHKLRYQRTATTINKISDSILSESYEEKEKLQTWKKSYTTDWCSKYSNSLTENEKCWKKNTTNNSTISPHISAYKNSDEVSTDSLNKSLQKSLLIQKQKEFSPVSTFVSQNPFKYKKQQNDKGSEPEVSQFKASQRLLNSNKSDLYFNTAIVKKTVTPRPIPLPRKLCNIPAIKAPSNLIFELTVNSEEEENVETKLSESSKPKPPPVNIPYKVKELNGSGLNVAYFVEGSDTTDHEMTWLSTSQSKSSINSNIIPIKVESKLLFENRIARIPSPTFQCQQTTLNLIPNEPLKMMQQHRKVESKMQPPSKRILNFSTKIESKLNKKPEIVGKKSKAVNLLPSKLPALSSTPSVPSMPMTFKVTKVNDDEKWMNVKTNDKFPKELIPCSTFQRPKTTKKLNLIQNDPLKMMQQPQRDEAIIPPPSKSSINKIELDLEQRIEIAEKSESKYASLLPSKIPVSAGTPSASMPMPIKVPNVNELGDDEKWMNVKITRKTPLLFCPSLSFRQTRTRTPNLFRNEFLKQRRESRTQFHRYDPKIPPTNIQISVPQQKLLIKKYSSKRPLPPPDKSHPKYKTEVCKRSLTYRGCPFGREGCNFLHPGETVPSFESFRKNRK